MKQMTPKTSSYIFVSEIASVFQNMIVVVYSIELNYSYQLTLLETRSLIVFTRWHRYLCT